MPQDEPRHVRTVRIATYNVHRCRGMDARTLPQRVAAVIAGLPPDTRPLPSVAAYDQLLTGTDHTTPTDPGGSP